MIRFSRMNIHNKLALVLVGAALLAFAMASAAFLFYENFTQEQRAKQAMEPYAQLVTVGTETAVAFNDAERAQEILDTLRSNPQILEAKIILQDGRMLAGYFRAPKASSHPHPFRADGVYLYDNNAELVLTLQDGAHFYLVMSLDEFNHQTRGILLLFTVAVVVLLAIVTLGLMVTLQRTIVRPIATLAETIEQVRTRANYDQHVSASGVDEVAQLGRSFNSMMTVIQERENDLRRLTLFQRAILDSVAYGIISTTPDGVITTFNPAAERLLGYTAEEVIGKQTPALWHDAAEVARRAIELSDELGEAIVPGFEVIAARPRRNLPEEGEWTFIRKNGSRLSVLLSISALHDDEGQITGFVGLTYDLTERKQAAKVLTQYAAIVESTDDAIVGKTLDGIITSWNKGAEHMFGYRADEIIGYSIGAVIPDERQSEEQEILDKIRHGASFSHYETVRRRKDGRLIDVSVTVSPLRNLQGEIVGVSKIARDITEHKKVEEELRKHREHLEDLVSDRTAQLEGANKELEAFSYSVSHDLRTPLRAIDGFSRLLEKKYADQLDDEARRLIGVVRDNAARMSQLIDDILAFSRTGRGEMHMAPVNMRQLVEAAWLDLEPIRAGRNIRFDLQDLPSAMGDAALLRQVWINLLSNAIKFTGSMALAHIEIGGRADSEAYTYYIKDDGVGFDQNYAHKLFGVFERLHAVNEFEGTGIGLAIVKRIVARHGGEVSGEGRVGEGAIFRFTLPKREV